MSTNRVLEVGIVDVSRFAGYRFGEKMTVNQGPVGVIKGGRILHVNGWKHGLNVAIKSTAHENNIRIGEMSNHGKGRISEVNPHEWYHPFMRTRPLPTLADCPRTAGRWLVAA